MNGDEKIALARLEERVANLIDAVDRLRSLWWKLALGAATFGGLGGFLGSKFGG